MLKKLLAVICLPAEITPFEYAYLGRVNRVAFAYLGLHLPVLVLIAWANQTNPLQAVVLTLVALVGPLLAVRTLSNPRQVSIVFSITAMLMGGLLVHYGRGIWTIEMHFYFFAVLALMTVYANPMAIIIGASTVAVHHALFWLIQPASVFNYEAPISTVLVHSAFLVLESIGACFVARSFFDNVISLDKIVQLRTREVEARSREMRLVLDNVSQGLLTLDRKAVISSERSRILTTWLGAPTSGQSFSEYLADHDIDFACQFQMGWDALLEDLLPFELLVDQLPKRLVIGKQTLEMTYAPILRPGGDGTWQEFLVVVSDITAQILREESEAEWHEMITIFEKVLNHRAAFNDFVSEAQQLVASLTDPRETSLSLLKRQVHTLKGNCSLYGLGTLGGLCHEIETRMEDENTGISMSDKNLLQKRWQNLSQRIAKFARPPEQRRIELEELEVLEFRQRVADGLAGILIQETLFSWTLEPIDIKLEHFALYARDLAARLKKSELQVEVEGNRIRIAPALWASFWGSFTHVIRNAVDHGLCTPEDRLQLGKSPLAKLVLRSYISDTDLVLEVSDDGCGVDWDKVQERARLMGVAADTPEQLTRALFQDGLSTKSEITEVSGRGVGLSAMRDVCEQLQGTMRILSAKNVGTTVQFLFPAQSIGQSTPTTARRVCKAS